jgi:hypothetical protein
MPSNYSPYNVAYELASLNANIIFLDVLRPLEEQQNLNKSLVVLVLLATDSRVVTYLITNVVELEESFQEEFNVINVTYIEPKSPPFYVSM